MSGRETLVLLVGTVCSLSIMGWIVWSERPVPVGAPTPTAPPATESARPSDPEPQDVDDQQVAALEAAASATPDDPSPRRSLGDLYFDARRFGDAIPWYEQVLALSPSDLDASTNLGVSYYYVGDTDRAIETFERAIEVDPSHQRALLSLGIVRAFGLQDLDGAMAAWEQVVAIAPDTPEGMAAQDSLDRLGSAHGAVGENDDELR